MSRTTWPEIYFIRHGETPWNAERRYQGRQDIPLNARGEAQALRNGEILAAELARHGRDPNSFEWHASPLQRTRETMARVRRAFAGPLPPVRFDGRLMEISFGVIEGLLHDELPAKMAMAPGERDASHWHFRPEEGENYADVEARLAAFAATLAGPSIIVSHGGIARTLRVLIEGADVGEAMNWAPPQDVVLHFLPGRMDIIAA